MEAKRKEMANKIHQAIAKNLIEVVRPMGKLSREQKIAIYYASIKGMATDPTYADEDLRGYDLLMTEAIARYKRCTR